MLQMDWEKRRWSKYGEWKICSSVFTLSLKPYIWKFHIVVWQATSKNSIKVHAARAARLLFAHSTDQIIVIWRRR